MKCCHFISHFLGIYPMAAEEDLRALYVATNPHMTKHMNRLFDNLESQASWIKPATLSAPKTREQEFYDAVNAIEASRKGGV